MTRPRRADPLTNPKDTPAEYAIAAALQALDRVASKYETAWGIGRLPRLVSPSTAARFDSARKKLNDAIASGDADTVATRAEIMVRGWHALDKEAREADNAPEDEDRFWCVRADDGTAFVFVQHETDTHLASRRFPDHRVWSMPEVIRVLTDPDLASINQVKQIFSGATVSAVRAVKTGPLDEDEIPF